MWKEQLNRELELLAGILSGYSRLFLATCLITRSNVGNFRNLMIISTPGVLAWVMLWCLWISCNTKFLFRQMWAKIQNSGQAGIWKMKWNDVSSTWCNESWGSLKSHWNVSFYMNASEASCETKNEQVFPQRNRKYEALEKLKAK